MYPPDYNPDSSCPYGCDFRCSHSMLRDCATSAGEQQRQTPEPLVYETEWAPEWAPSDDPATWMTRNGPVRLADMSDVHLARALAVAIAKDGLKHSRSKALLAELRSRAL